MSDSVNRIDFLAIGSPRAGTTFLDALLRGHPEIFLPESRKEMHFFDDHYARGTDWYLAYFEEATSEQRCGEVTPSYLDHPEVAARVAKTIPGVRSIVVLRDPVERAFSHYLRLQSQRNDQRSFIEALADGSRVLGASLYGQGLARWLEHFPEDDVFVMESAKLFDHSGLGDLATFLDVDPLGFTAPDGAVNQGGQAYSRAGRSMKAVSRFAYRHGIDDVVRVGKRVVEALPIDPRGGAKPRSITPEEYSDARLFFEDDLALLDGLCGAEPRTWWPTLWD